MLTNIFVALLFTVMAATPPPTQVTPAGRDDRAELARLETVWNQAHERGDAEALEHLWADDLEIAVPKMPVLLKPDAVRFWRSARIRFSRYQTSDLRIRIYDTAAVVTGRLQRTRTINDRQLDDDWRFTKVYVRRSNAWKVVAFHASEAASQ